MFAIQKNGDAVEIADFKAVRGGIVLFEDEDRDETIGFIPSGSLDVVLTEELARERGYLQPAEPGMGATSGQQAPPQAQSTATPSQQGQSAAMPSQQPSGTQRSQQPLGTQSTQPQSPVARGSQQPLGTQSSQQQPIGPQSMQPQSRASTASEQQPQGGTTAQQQPQSRQPMTVSQNQ